MCLCRETTRCMSLHDDCVIMWLMVKTMINWSPSISILMIFNKRIVQYNFIALALWVTRFWIANNTAIQYLLCNICKCYGEMHVNKSIQAAELLSTLCSSNFNRNLEVSDFLYLALSWSVHGKEWFLSNSDATVLATVETGANLKQHACSA